MKLVMQNSMLSFRTIGEPDFEGEVARLSTSGTQGREWILAIPAVSAGEKIFFQLRGDLAMSGLVGRAYIKDRSGSGTVISDVVEFPNGVSDSFSDEYSGTLTVTADAASNVYFQYYSEVNPNPERKLYVRAWTSNSDSPSTGISAPVVIVDKKGKGDFTTIADAVAGTNDGDTIFICPGVYEESVHMWGKERHLVGMCKDTCILKNGTGNYLTPPLEANIGSVENLTIIADNYAPTISDPSVNQTKPGYGIHIEYNNATPYTFRISNCKILSKWNSGVGIGVRYNQTIIIENSELVSESIRVWSSWINEWVEMGGLFFHNDAESNTAGQGVIVVSNTRLTGKKAALIMESVENKPGTVEAEFIGCTLKSVDYGVTSSVIFRYPNATTPSGYLCGTKITLAESSHGNNNSELNA